MFELFILAIGLIIGYHVGAVVLAWRLRDVILREAKANGIDISGASDNTNEDNTNAIKVNRLFIEHANDLMYLYDEEAASFVCQGKSVDELATLAKQFKNIKYAAVMDSQTDTIFTFVDGKVVNES